MTGRKMVLSIVLLLLAAVLFAAPAEAHKMKVFAAAEGAVISGYAYFSGGGRAAGVEVTAVASTAEVFRGTTDADGSFRFTAESRADHRITAASADGHAAAFTLRAAELPADLPAGPTAQSPPPAATAPVAAPLDLRAEIDAAVARQVRPLREQIEAYRDEIRWHDVLGGIGYIVGLAGLAYGLTARRRKGPPA